MRPEIFAYIAVMALVTYLIRLLPLTLIRRRITNKYIRSFLYYVPYATLSAMTFLAILSSTGSTFSAALGFAAALFLAFRGKSLLSVAVFASAVVLVCELLFPCCRCEAGAAALFRPCGMRLQKAKRLYPFRIQPFFSFFRLSLVFEMRRHRFQVLDDRQVLRTYALALAARDAVARLAEIAGQVVVIFALWGPALALDLLHIGVVEREIFRDRDVHRAAVHAVGAAGAGDCDVRVDPLHSLLHDRALRLAERLKVLHVAGVVEQLLHGAHAGEHDLHVRQARRKADGPRRHRHLRRERLEHFRDRIRYSRERAALNRLHDKYRYAVLLRNLVARARDCTPALSQSR